MTWENWTIYANSVLTWFLSLVPTLLALVMENPLLGVPAIIVVVGLLFNLVLRFVGAFRTNKED